MSMQELKAHTIMARHFRHHLNNRFIANKS